MFQVPSVALILIRRFEKQRKRTWGPALLTSSNRFGILRREPHRCTNALVCLTAMGTALHEKTFLSVALPPPRLMLPRVGPPCRYTVLGVHEFDSSRKRMSVVVRGPDGGVRLLVKGADSAMVPLLGALYTSKGPVHSRRPSWDGKLVRAAAQPPPIASILCGRKGDLRKNSAADIWTFCGHTTHFSVARRDLHAVSLCGV